MNHTKRFFIHLILLFATTQAGILVEEESDTPFFKNDSTAEFKKLETDSTEKHESSTSLSKSNNFNETKSEPVKGRFYEIHSKVEESLQKSFQKRTPRKQREGIVTLGLVKPVMLYGGKVETPSYSFSHWENSRFGVIVGYSRLKNYNTSLGISCSYSKFKRAFNESDFTKNIKLLEIMFRTSKRFYIRNRQMLAPFIDIGGTLDNHGFVIQDSDYHNTYELISDSENKTIAGEIGGLLGGGVSYLFQTAEEGALGFYVSNHFIYKFNDIPDSNWGTWPQKYVLLKAGMIVQLGAFR